MAGKAYIFGNGGHAHVIASFLTADVTFLVSQDPQAKNEMSQQEFIEGNLHGDVYIGIGSNVARTRIFKMLVEKGISPATCVAPNAFIARSAVVEPGAVICAGAIIGARARIGVNTIVNTLSSVDHDCILGNHSQVTAGVTLGGTVTVGSNCFFGIKSAVIPGLSIGDNSKIMAGSVVSKNVPPDVLVGGSPAKVIRSLEHT
jgi:UDP-perosamine 4-acetyltransferase